MSAHEERRAQAFRKTDETEQSLIVGSTILLGSIPLFPGVSRPTARKPIPLMRLRRGKQGKSEERSCPRAETRASPALPCKSVTLLHEPSARSSPLPCLPSPAGLPSYISHNDTVYMRDTIHPTSFALCLYTIRSIYGESTAVVSEIGTPDEEQEQ